ncbi:MULTISPECIES: hypothetical protein [Francisella]|uniref:Uncharacterized protein n=1 Tax=Francisella opportunistica TaxID=2016517 RepID=A0A345JSY8_9GAMM|nr:MULTISPECIES: hypothetical protein [Francisella]APC92219.1 hypothetical protein BBG19_1491 [Francisella sp. MA067296]AXH30434.1 hypothetical protein CGC43_07505 [Francisella opportunistica]AXH32075.1 hypothetical protein CGC44_07480 [Francisella opportunistica]AXH33722.1 hypothetical protein CGC45_07510 [Francisella opportunistica]
MWAAIFTGVLSASLPGIFTLLGVYIANRSNLKRYELEQRDKNLKLRLDKLEQLYLLFNDWAKWQYSLYLSYLKYTDIKSDVSRLNKILNEFDKKDLIGDNRQKQEMLISLYFADELQPYYNNILEILDKHLYKYNLDLPKNTEGNTNFLKDLEIFKQSCEIFKEKISEHSKLIITV